MRLYRNISALILVAGVTLVLSIVLLFNNYSDNNITGNDIVNTKVELYPTQSKNCSFELYPGWNMVSFYCFGLYVDRDIALQSLNGNYESIFKYQSNDINDPWKSYDITLPNWTVQQVNYMDRVSGYWIFMLNSATFVHSGVYSDSTIYLNNGWNLVGYPINEARNISDFYTDISFNIVKYYNTSEDVWLIYLKNNSNNSLNQFETYKGYWLNVSGDQQWHLTRQ